VVAEVAPGVIQVESHGPLTFLRMARRIFGRPVYWTGAYLVEGVLVDCGPPATAGELLAFLEGKPLRGLLVTHHHEDHMGGAALLARRRSLVARAHPAAVPLMAHGYPQEAYRRVAWGRPPRIDAEPVTEEVAFGPLRFQPVATPGHSGDHLCFFEPDRGWLFTGDLFLAERLRFLRSDEDVDLLIESLETVGRLPLREVLCAHRGPVRDGPAALRRKAERLRALRESIATLLRQGLPEGEITRRVVGREGFLTWFSRGRFSARNFVRAVARKPFP
jgi:glyoxylase-like metal-dependent hydrolase (beta-lactamase superfamily II)